MQRMWVSLRENIKCGSNLSDVLCYPKMATKLRREGYEKKGPYKRIDIHFDNHAVNNGANHKQCSSHRNFEELDVGDPSRKVIEMILAAYLTSPAKRLPDTRRVFKVNNSHKVVEKFEKYRDMVKHKAKEREQKHPRSLVDGNELLCFYVTTMTCHNRHPKWVLRPCQDPNCSLCTTIGFFSFNAEYTRRSRIQLCISREALGESVDAISYKKNVKTAVIMCRIIAGRTRSIEEDMTSEDEYDSVMSRGLHPNSEYLALKNPSALLPCFIIVLN